MQAKIKGHPFIFAGTDLKISRYLLQKHIGKLENFPICFTWHVKTFFYLSRIPFQMITGIPA